MTRAEARKILGVSQIASEADIKKAYRKLCKENHPDNSINDDEKKKEIKAKKFKEINDAYKRLESEDAYNDEQGPKSDSNDIFNGESFVDKCIRFCNERAFDKFQKVYEDLKKELDEYKIKLSYSINEFLDSKNRGRIDSEKFKQQEKIIRKTIENAKAFDEFQEFYIELQKAAEKYKLRIDSSINELIDQNNRGKVDAKKFYARRQNAEEKLEIIIKNRKAFDEFQEFYIKKQQEATNYGFTLTCGDVYLKNGKIESKDWKVIKSEIEKEFSHKRYQLQRYNELMIQLDIIEPIFIQHGKSLDEPKEYLEEKSINQFKKYVVENRETINFADINFVQTKLNNEVRVLIEEKREKYISEINKLDKKHSLYKMIGTDFNTDYMTIGELELSIKSLAEFMTNSSSLSRKIQLFSFAGTLRKQLADYRKKVLEISTEIEEICRNKNVVMLSLFLPSPYKLDYLSYEELQAIRDNLLKRFSLEQTENVEMDEEQVNNRTA